MEAMQAAVRAAIKIPDQVTPQELFDLGVEQGRGQVRQMVIAIVRGCVYGQRTSAENYALRLAVMARQETENVLCVAELRAECQSLVESIQELQAGHDSAIQEIRTFHQAELELLKSEVNIAAGANLREAALRREFDSEKSWRIGLEKQRDRLRQELDSVLKQANSLKGQFRAAHRLQARIDQQRATIERLQKQLRRLRKARAKRTSN